MVILLCIIYTCNGRVSHDEYKCSLSRKCSCMETAVVGLKVSLGLYIGIQKTGWAMVMHSLNLFMKLGVLVLGFFLIDLIWFLCNA